VAANRPAQNGIGRRKGRQGTEPDTPAPAKPEQPGRDRQLVAVDPWAMLLEQFMDAPDEAEPSEPKPRREGEGAPGPARTAPVRRSRGR